AGRSGIAAIGQRDYPGAVGDQIAKAAKEASEKIAVAVEVENDRMAGLGRDMPDDDFFTVRRGQNMLFGLRKAGLLRRRAHDSRDRKQKRALREKQHRKTADISDRNDNQQPFQDDHDLPRAGLQRLDDILGHLLGVA